jgi:hypothetical protein
MKLSLQTQALASCSAGVIAAGRSVTGIDLHAGIAVGGGISVAKHRSLWKSARSDIGVDDCCICWEAMAHSASVSVDLSVQQQVVPVF